MKFSVFDIECKNWNEFLGLGWYNGSEYRFFDSIDSFLQFAELECAGKVIFAHNGGKYDFLFLLDSLLPYGSSTKFTAPENLLLINGSLIRFQWGGVEFRDSLSIMPGSIARIAPFFGQKKLEMDYDNIENQDWKTYLQQDCVALYEILRQYLEYLSNAFNITPGVTLASTAMKIYKKHFNRIPEWRSYFEDKTRKSYLGGRCEIFKTTGNKLNGYDINSMYPYVMHSKLFPVGRPSIEYKNCEKYIDNEGIICARVFCPDLYIPLLPIRMAKKMVFLKGEIKGTWTLPEFRKALELGYKIKSIQWVIRYHKSKRIFKDYIDKLYTIKRNAKNEGIRYIAKILQNASYGKFGTRRDKSEIFFPDPRKSYANIRDLCPVRGIAEKPKELDASYIMPIIASYVTSYARLELYKYLDHQSYYCDTDSVFTTKKLPTSEKLGAMKLEYDNIDRAYFYYPKVYDIGHKVKAKGFSLPPGKERAYFDRIVRKEEIDITQILSFKQCCISHKRFSSKRVLTRSIKQPYNKRKVLSNGETEPWTYDEYLNQPGTWR